MDDLFILLFASPIISLDMSRLHDYDQWDMKGGLPRQKKLLRDFPLAERDSPPPSSWSEDGNMRWLELPSQTMRKTTRALFRLADSLSREENESLIIPLNLSHWSNQLQNHIRPIFVWEDIFPILFTSIEAGFLINIPKPRPNLKLESGVTLMT